MIAQVHKQTNTRKIEIMSPAGSFESLTAALNAGADSVYFGISKLNMRARAANNFTCKDLNKIVSICRKKGVKTYLAVNIILYDSDLKEMKKIVNLAKKNCVTAIIAADIAAIKYANQIGMETHISTQANVSNIEAVKFFSKYADVIVLARELTLPQIKNICDAVKKENIRGPNGKLVRIELFAHGALCVSISGKCYMSLANYNTSANRGNCLQACRRAYKITDEETGDELVIDNKYVMSPKDLCTIKFLDKILQTGISVLKIEGRGRSADYVHTVTKVYREAASAYLEKTYTSDKIEKWVKQLETVFNRGFWHGGYYLGKKLGEWSGVYGSRATKQKILIGKAVKYFPKIKVAELKIESYELNIRDDILFTGPATGALTHKITSMRADDKSITKATKGDVVTIPLDKRVRKNDKLFIVKNKINY